MPLSGQPVGDEEQGPRSTPAIPGSGIYEARCTNKRTNVVRLLPNGAQERRLRKLASISARLFNEVNYERRQQFFREGKIDLRGTWNKYYEKYKDRLGSANTQAALQKNNEAWSSFFTLLRLKKEGKLPPHIRRVSPPGYWKDRENGRRKLILVTRQDRPEMDAEQHKLILKDFKMEISFAGRLRWYGKQGRLEIIYDDAKNAWYAHIPVEVGVEETKTGKKSKHIIKGERKSIQIATPKGSKIAAIDLGINVIASVVVSDGTWLLYKGVRTKEDYFYLQRRIAEVQSLADKTKNLGEYEAYQELLREKRRLFRKLTRRLLHLYRNMASHLLAMLHEQGVSTIYIGYPLNIAQDNGNKFTVNMWSYSKLLEAIELEAQEYGMRVYEVLEYNTSKYCAYHDVQVKRVSRGVITCPKRHKIHSDLNAALNIMKKAAGIIIQTVRKPLSFIVDHNRVAPTKGCNAQDPSKTPSI